MKKIVFSIIVFLILFVSTSNSLIIHAPAGSVWTGPNGSTFEKGIVTYLSIHWVDYYNGIADQVTVGCDPDVVFCWQIINEGKDLEIGLLVHPPTDSTNYSTITTNN